MRAGLTGLGLVFVATLSASVIMSSDAPTIAKEPSEPLAQLGVAPSPERPGMQTAPAGPPPAPSAILPPAAPAPAPADNVDAADATDAAAARMAVGAGGQISI